MSEPRVCHLFEQPTIKDPNIQSNFTQRCLLQLKPVDKTEWKESLPKLSAADCAARFCLVKNVASAFVSLIQPMQRDDLLRPGHATSLHANINQVRHLSVTVGQRLSQHLPQAKQDGPGEKLWKMDENRNISRSWSRAQNMRFLVSLSTWGPEPCKMHSTLFDVS